MGWRAITLEKVSAVRFRDVAETDRLRGAISYAAFRRLFQTDGRYFRPDERLTCGQMVAALHNLEDALDGRRNRVGGDLEWAVAARILRENSPADYGENALVTRAQTVTMLYRFAQHHGVGTSASGNLSAYPDAERIPAYARLPFSWAMERGVLRAVAADSLCPDLCVTREQAAAMLTALVASIANEPVAKQVAAASALPAFSSASRAQHADIRQYVEDAAQQYGASGVQVAVIENGHVTDTYAWGWATPKTDPMTAEHKMRIASISKAVIGMVTLRMTEDGLVDLDAPVGRYWNTTFQNPYYPDRPVTVRSILTHTSSIVTLNSDSAVSAAEVKNRQQNGYGYLRTTPGAYYSWGYNNYAFCVLGITLELASGKTVDRLLHQYFLDAFDEDASFYAGSLKDTRKLVTPTEHDGSVGFSIPAQLARRAGAAGSKGHAFAGGLTISATGLAKLVSILAGDGYYEGVRLMRPETVAEMETYDSHLTVENFYQALALRRKNDIYGRDALYYHTGSAYGVYSLISYDPASGDGVVVLTVGAREVRDEYGIYSVCGNISRHIYEAIKR